MEINHTFHEHTLVLSEEKRRTSFSCYICGESVFSLSYCCLICPFVLHKWCADLPLELSKFPLRLSKLLRETSEFLHKLMELPREWSRLFPELSKLFHKLSEFSSNLPPEFHRESTELLPKSQDLLHKFMKLVNELSEFPSELSEFLDKLKELPRKFSELLRKLSELLSKLSELSESPRGLSNLLSKLSKKARLWSKHNRLLPCELPRMVPLELSEFLANFSELLLELTEFSIKWSELLCKLSEFPHELSQLFPESSGLSCKLPELLHEMSKVPLMYSQLFHKFLEFPSEPSQEQCEWSKLSNLHPALSMLLHMMSQILYTNDHQTLILSRIESSFNPSLCGVCQYPIESRSFAYTSTVRSLSIKVHLECTVFPLGRYTQRKGNKRCFLCRTVDEIPKIVEQGLRRSYLHIHCAVLPRTVKHSVHLHELTLHQSLIEDDWYFQFICDACEEDRDPTSPVYYCCENEKKPCKFVAHIGCGVFGSDPPPIQDVLGTQTVYKFILPESEKEEEEEQGEGDNVYGEGEGEGDQMEHFTHTHPLTLKSFKMSSNLWQRRCSACRQCIFGMTYACVEESCRSNWGSYYLHKWCAQLPKVINCSIHALHGPLKMLESQLIESLDKEQLTEKDSALICRLCGMDTIRLSYGCEKCDFQIHSLCALVPDDLNHQSHEHTLTVVISTGIKYKDYEIPKYKLPFGSSENPLCQACGFLCLDVLLECKICDFHLHVHCFLLPYTGKHTTHRHHLSLTYSYEEDPRALEYICDTCEKPRIPNRWVYCCPDPKCYIVSHVDCVVPKYFTTFEHQS